MRLRKRKGFQNSLLHILDRVSSSFSRQLASSFDFEDSRFFFIFPSSSLLNINWETKVNDCACTCYHPCCPCRREVKKVQLLQTVFSATMLETLWWRRGESETGGVWLWTLLTNQRRVWDTVNQSEASIYLKLVSRREQLLPTYSERIQKCSTPLWVYWWHLNTHWWLTAWIIYRVSIKTWPNY